MPTLSGSPTPLLVTLGLAALLVLWLLGQHRWVAWRRQRVRRQPFPEAWRKILQQRVPYVRRMPPDLQLQLKKHIQVFLAEKVFIGCGGLHITDEIRVTIAAQACLLILNRPTDYYPKLRQILVYPGAFVVRHTHADAAGVMQEPARVLTGESWSQGQVVLSWRDAAAGAAVVDDAQNVVIHEFAHQLDTEKGHANGAPILRGPQGYGRWSAVMQAEYARLQSSAAHAMGDETLHPEHSPTQTQTPTHTPPVRGPRMPWRLRAGAPDHNASAPAAPAHPNEPPHLLDPYGATDPAEFFAVASEAFFEQPAEMARRHPALYQELSSYYRVNPLSW